MFEVVVVLIGHKAEVGKDTMGRLLVERRSFQRFGFADKLKDTVADLYGFTYAQMHEHHAKNTIDTRYDLTPRQVLQDFGQEQRARNPNIWCDYVFDKMGGCSYNVITDFRFPNEYEVAKEWALIKPFKEVVTLKINRPESSQFSGSENESETALDDFAFDYTYNNTGTIEEMYDSVINMLYS